MKKFIYGLLIAVVVLGIFVLQTQTQSHVDSVQITTPVLAKTIDRLVQDGKLTQEKKASLVADIAQNDDEYGFFACIPDFLAWDLEGLDQRINDYENSASEFGDETSQIIYSVFSNVKSSQERIERLHFAMESGAQHPIIALNFIKYCSDTDSPLCTAEAIEKAIQLDYHNGAIWLNAANYFSKQNDEAKVVESLEKTLQASSFNERGGEQTLIYAEALEAEFGLSFSVGALAGFGYVIAQPNSLNHLSNWCNDNSVDDLVFDICLSASSDIFLRANSTLTKMLANGIRHKLFSSRGDNASLERIEKQGVDNYPKGLSRSMELMLMLDPQLAYKYFTMFDLLGEGSTQSMIMKDSETLYANFDSCSAINSLSEHFL